MSALLTLCFGALGLASLACWLAALLAGALLGQFRRAGPLRAAAALLALAGLVLAYVTVARVGRIEIDRSAERRAAADEKARVRDEARKVLKRKAAKVRFAEDGANDSLDVAGIRRIDNPVIAAATANVEEEQAAVRGLVLPEPQVQAARTLGRLNLCAAWFALLFVCGALAVGYLTDFNRRLDRSPRLPLASRALDAFFPPPDPVVRMEPAEFRKPEFLARLIRRGDSFIYLGSLDPLQAAGVTPSVAAGALPEGEVLPPGATVEASLPRFALGRLRAGRVPVESVAGESLPLAAALYQSVWEARSALIVTDPAGLNRWLDALLLFMRIRCDARTTTFRAVNIIWDGPAETLAAPLEELSVLCLEGGFRLICAPAAAPKA